MRLKVEGRYPYDGAIKIRFANGAAAAAAAPFALSLRIPDWCPTFSLAVNGKRVASKAISAVKS